MLLSGRSLVSPQADPSASLGDEAPLSADGRERRTIEGRGINMRWFSGTVLTGLCGAGLMGGAVWAALEYPTRPPAPAEILQPLTRSGSGAGERPTNTARKGDRLTPLADLFSSSKQTIRASSPTSSRPRAATTRFRSSIRCACWRATPSSGRRSRPRTARAR